mmetsp:Transcript_134765/g.237616  ORF Transcript_134765/g.237616 Transcript_134765/m.237616 type:complete len:202 (+) Transcript_134765:351-956(+)
MRPISANEKVIWLDVTMHYSNRMHMFYAFCHLDKEGSKGLFVEEILTLQCCQQTAFALLHNKVAHAVTHEEVKKVDDIGMCANLPPQNSFTGGHLLLRSAHVINFWLISEVNDLDCLLFILLVLYLVTISDFCRQAYLRKSSSTQLGSQNILVVKNALVTRPPGIAGALKAYLLLSAGWNRAPHCTYASWWQAFNTSLNAS